MNDPIGLVSSLSGGIEKAAVGVRAPDKGAESPSFKELLKEQITSVNELQKDADRAMEDLVTGRRNDVESVMIATEKADLAFQMLLQVRNKVVDAYEEIKQLRV